LHVVADEGTLRRRRRNDRKAGSPCLRRCSIVFSLKTIVIVDLAARLFRWEQLVLVLALAGGVSSARAGVVASVSPIVAVVLGT